MKKFLFSDPDAIASDFHSIKVRLVRLNMDQLDLCRAIGVTASCMSKWLSMATNMPYVARCAIEYFLCKSEFDAFGHIYDSDDFLVRSLALCSIRGLFSCPGSSASEASSKRSLVSESLPSELLG